MLQSKRFGKRLFSLVNVAAFGTRSRQKLGASVLVLLAAASVSTAAYALKLQIFVDGAQAALIDTALSPFNQADQTGPSDSGTPLTVTIPNNNYPLGCTPPTSTAPGTCLLNVVGGTATATVIKNNTLISTSTSIVTKVNVSGNFKYLGPLKPTPATPLGGSIEIVTSNKFILPTGVWTTAGKGGSKVWKTTSGAYVANATCFPNSSTIQSGSCTFGRSYNSTDEGYVYRTVSGAQRPAGGVSIQLRSLVGFFDTAGNEVRTENVGGAFPANPRVGDDPNLPFSIPEGSTYQEDAHFYLGTSLGGAGEVIPCEPLNTNPPANATFTCANNERKTNKLKFTKLSTNDLVNLPVTSTDLGASDSGILALHSNAKILVDVQPIGVIENTRTEDPEAPPQIQFPFLGDTNNDWNPTKTSGKKQVLALNSYKPDGSINVDACGVQHEDAWITVAGSVLVQAASSQEAVKDGRCIGRVFSFDYEPVNATIPVGEGFLTKLDTCAANPTVTLFLRGVTLTSEYQVDNPQQGGRSPSGFVPPDSNCVYNPAIDPTKATCTVQDAEVSGSQLVRCCTSCG